jgi:hypothetical protein
MDLLSIYLSGLVKEAGAAKTIAKSTLVGGLTTAIPTGLYARRMGKIRTSAIIRARRRAADGQVESAKKLLRDEGVSLTYLSNNELPKGASTDLLAAGVGSIPGAIAGAAHGIGKATSDSAAKRAIKKARLRAAKKSGAVAVGGSALGLGAGALLNKKVNS